MPRRHSGAAALLETPANPPAAARHPDRPRVDREVDHPAATDGAVVGAAASLLADAARRRRRRHLASIVVTGAGLAAAGYVLRGTVPHPTDVVGALHSATAGWLTLAAVAQVVSMDMFARQQRRLLAAFGVTMSISRAAALTYARSALSISMPAGAVVSAGFAYRQYRLRGASHRIAASVMLLSGVLSAAALTVLYVAWVGAAAVGGPARAHPGILVAGLAATGAAGWAITRRRANRAPSLTPTPADQRSDHGSLLRLAARWPWGARLLIPVADALDSVGTIRRRDWAAALTFAVGNWVADLACLIAVAYAFGLTLTVVQIAGGYLLVQLVRQVPITPGGIGVIEASLLIALVAAGAPQVTAAAVVLIYRVLSCWAIVPTGLLAWIGLAVHGAGRPSTRGSRACRVPATATSGRARTESPATGPVRRRPRRPLRMPAARGAEQAAIDSASAAPSSVALTAGTADLVNSPTPTR